MTLSPSKRPMASVVLGVIFIASLSGCTPPVRRIAGAGTKPPSSDVPTAKDLATEDSGAIPPPPPPVASRASRTARQSLSGGPSLCVEHRPDLRSATVRIDPRAPLRPEVMLALQGWIEEAWSRAFSPRVLDFDSPVCRDAFVCAAVEQAGTVDATTALLRTLIERPPTAFFAKRGELLDEASERDRSDPLWKLQTTAHALAAPSDRLSFLARSEPSPLAPDLEKALLADTGRNVLNGMTIADARRSLAAALPSFHLVVSTAFESNTVARQVSATWTPSTETAQESDAPSELPSPFGAMPVPLVDGAAEWTHALLMFLPSEEYDLLPLELAYRVVAGRVDASDSTARVTIQGSASVYSVPSLRIDGPYDEVQALLSKLQEQLDHYVATGGAPSASEWSRAVTRRPTASPCLDRRLPTSEEAREAVRRAGLPLRVIWGAPDKTTTATEEPTPGD